MTNPLPPKEGWRDDWVLVPKEPTQNMLDWATTAKNYDGPLPTLPEPDHDYDDDLRRAWKAMLAAVPLLEGEIQGLKGNEDMASRDGDTGTRGPQPALPPSAVDPAAGND